MINFTDKLLYISSFVLWSIKDDQDPISWYAEGCYKGICYNLTEYNSTEIKEKEVFKTKVHGPFDSFRYVSTGANYWGDYFHCVNKLEFYGATSDIINMKYSCMKKHHNQTKFLLLMILYTNY